MSNKFSLVPWDPEAGQIITADDEFGDLFDDEEGEPYDGDRKSVV